MLYVACFAVGAYPSAERTYKPFNPILGETFELKQGSMRYIAEQARLMTQWPSPLRHSDLPALVHRCHITRPLVLPTAAAPAGRMTSPARRAPSSWATVSTSSPSAALASR